MRWLLRLVMFWAICAPLFYLFGLPYLLDYTSKKLQREQYAQCMEHLKTEGLIGALNSGLNQQQGETYCHCMSDSLVFTKEDLLDAAQKKEPVALTALAQSLADTCTQDLRKVQGLVTDPNAPTPAPAEDVFYITP